MSSMGPGFALQQGPYRLHERADRDRLCEIPFGASVADAFLVALAGIGRNGEHRNRAQGAVFLRRFDQIEAGDVRQLDVHDNQVGHELTRTVQRVETVGNGIDSVALACEHVAEELPVEIVVLDNENSLCHLGPWIPSWVRELLYDRDAMLTILPKEPSPSADASALALGALGWVLGDGDRAQRFLDLTGLTPDELRTSLGEPSTLAGVLEFLCSHEPDLIGAADALGIEPQALAAARERLGP